MNIAITLARGGSKSIPEKNIALVGGKSLLQRTCEVAHASGLKHYVSSDCYKILDAAERYGSIPMLRPPELATDTAGSAEAIIQCVAALPDKPENIIELMCTSPFKTAKDVLGCLDKLTKTACDSVVGVHRILDHHPARLKYIEHDTLMDFYPEVKESRRQDLTPHAYVRNGSIYAFAYDSLMEHRSRYGGLVRPYIMPAERCVNIDEPLDLEIANLLAVKHGW